MVRTRLSALRTRKTETSERSESVLQENVDAMVMYEPDQVCVCDMMANDTRCRDRPFREDTQ